MRPFPPCAERSCRSNSKLMTPGTCCTKVRGVVGEAYCSCSRGRASATRCVRAHARYMQRMGCIHACMQRRARRVYTEGTTTNTLSNSLQRLQFARFDINRVPGLRGPGHGTPATRCNLCCMWIPRGKIQPAPLGLPSGRCLAEFCMHAQTPGHDVNPSGLIPQACEPLGP